MRLIVRDTNTEAAEYVASYILQRIKEYGPTPERPFVLGLPTGGSPTEVYRLLAASYKAGEVSFENVVTFNMDEYVGIPRDHPQTYHSFMWTHFFSHVNVRPENVHILDGNAPDLEAECARFEDLIQEAGGIDLFLAGIGEDGHVAFNEPGSSLASRTRVKTLAYDTILANSRFFGNDVNQVPRMALTVGVQTVLDAREVVTLALGARKAVALQKCIEGGVNHMWTLSGLQLHRHSMIVADEDATLELQVKTVKYFKSIEQIARQQGFEQGLPRGLRKGKGANGVHVNGSVVVNGVHSPIALKPANIDAYLLRANSPVLAQPTSRSVTPEPTLDNLFGATKQDEPAESPTKKRKRQVEDNQGSPKKMRQDRKDARRSSAKAFLSVIVNEKSGEPRWQWRDICGQAAPNDLVKFREGLTLEGWKIRCLKNYDYHEQRLTDNYNRELVTADYPVGRGWFNPKRDANHPHQLMPETARAKTCGPPDSSIPRKVHSCHG
ncbi:Glucosamine-6-phosphate isomerase (Glucosamine-6-phosphate deaminase) (GNPDA) (GlcN6P deaminase) [Fusarium falciforme]|nr:Glucosamine-6-phosphate isomerase (Glucosamine-6-phosphate deaminase) (GNPDA) (GlcN6P deaminase) [Fusarium falciforme]